MDGIGALENEFFDVRVPDDGEDREDSDGEEIADRENAKPRVKNKNDADCCQKRCLSNFDVGFRSRLKSSLSRLGKSEKQIYLFGMISISEDKRFRPGSVKTSSRLFRYGVRRRGEMSFVCKTAFIDLHDTTVTAVRTLCAKMTNKSVLIPSDNRGRHQSHYFIPEPTRELIETHFYAVLESTSIFKCTNMRLGKPNVKQLWIDFTQKYGDLGYPVSRNSYIRYTRSLLTPDNLLKFKTASVAYELFQKSQGTIKKKKLLKL